VTAERLEPGSRLLVEISAALAARDDFRLDEALRRASEGGAKQVEVEETLLQSYLFLGYPAALTGIARWREIAGPPPAESDALASPEQLDEWTERGTRVCERVYGRAYGKLRGNIARAHPAMDRWMVAEGYGKVLGRPDLPLRVRELCNVAVLAATTWEPQLHSHLRGAMNSGATCAEVEEALEIGLKSVAAGDAKRARRLWNRVRSAHGEEAHDVH
jgi:4-carboxymuconolactone decarboxylase